VLYLTGNSSTTPRTWPILELRNQLGEEKEEGGAYQWEGCAAPPRGHLARCRLMTSLRLAPPIAPEGWFRRVRGGVYFRAVLWSQGKPNGPMCGFESGYRTAIFTDLWTSFQSGPNHSEWVLSDGNERGLCCPLGLPWEIYIHPTSSSGVATGGAGGVRAPQPPEPRHGAPLGCRWKMMKERWVGGGKVAGASLGTVVGFASDY
jgi:hypothetical protein